MLYVTNLPDGAEFSSDDLEAYIVKLVVENKDKLGIKEEDLTEVEDGLIVMFLASITAPNAFANSFAYLRNNSAMRVKDCVFAGLYASAQYNVMNETVVADPIANVYSKAKFLDAAALAYDFAAQVNKIRRVYNEQSPKHEH